MRRSFILYLFVFAVLIAVFLYASSRRMLDAKDSEIEALKNENLELVNAVRSSEGSLSSELFLFEDNDQAMSYFEERGITVDSVKQLIEDNIISRNKISSDNDLVPYEGMDGNMRVNSIRILNHKWILADFTDGTHWGELFITYYFTEEGEVILETENSLLYPTSN